MDNQLLDVVASNNKKLNSTQRRTNTVRSYGEEHSGSTTGPSPAVVYLTVDNAMCYISDYKFKIVFDTGNADMEGTPSPADIVSGRNQYPTLESWLQAYPIGTAIDVDNNHGAQCWDYAAAFWMAQCDRTFTTGGTGAARGAWAVASARTQNRGSEFDLITNWGDILPGDWIIWGDGTYGHVAMASWASEGSTCKCYGQNQASGIPWPQGGSAVSEDTLSSKGFLGAFRYKAWH